MKNSTKQLVAPPLSLKVVLPKRSVTPAELPAAERASSIPAAPLLPAPLLLVAAALAVEPTPATSASPPPVSRHPTPSAIAAVAPSQEIDIRIEAGKIPLHIAVMESILAAGTPDRQKRLSQNVLIVGGTSLIHNVGFAIESRFVSLLPIRT